jgi:transposase-like protein
MVYVQVHCPDCQCVDVVRYGKQRRGEQRYRCNNTDCPRHIFLLHYRNQGRLPTVKQQMVDMALNGSGIRDTARVLRVSPTTVINTLKKKSQAYSKSMKDFSSVLMLSRCRSSSTRWRQPRWMKCGALWAAKASSGGCGTRLIITRDRSWLMSLAHVRMQPS